MTRPADVTDRGMKNGVWTLRIGSGDAPDLIASHRGETIEDIAILRDDEGWQARVTCPPAALSDGAQTLTLRDARSGETVATTTIVAGRAVDRDLVAEVVLLRAELDLLKRAFRKHCAQAPQG